MAAVPMQSSWGLTILRVAVAAPLILVGAGLSLVACKMGGNGGELAGIPALICLLGGVGVARAKNRSGFIASMVVSILAVLVLFGGLSLLGAMMSKF
jgi:hypothetical protein